MALTIHVDIVSAESAIFSGLAEMVFAPAALGEEARRAVAAGDEPQLVVKGGSFKSVRLEPGADYGIIGEGVAPGFDFRDFKFVTRGELKRLSAEAFAKHADLVKPDPEDDFDHYYDEAKK